MPCIAPLTAWRTGDSITIAKQQPQGNPPFIGLPCGSCIECNKRRGRDWAIRCQLETQDHQVSTWGTLTYDDKHLPPTLIKRHLSGFMKRLRKNTGELIRFFAVGEYGDRSKRPHYHAILFGFNDEQQLQRAWPYGFTRLDRLSPAAIAYVTRYQTKKAFARDLTERERVDTTTGELYTHQPTFIQMSRRPGIGASARRHWSSWRHAAIWGGQEVPVPRYLHDAWKHQATPQQLQQLQEEQQQNALTRHIDLEAVQAIALRKLEHQLSRSKI